MEMCRLLLFAVFLAVLFSSSRTSSSSSSSAETRIFRPGENLTLHCNIASSTHTAWYRLRHAHLTLILSATRGTLDNQILNQFTPDPSHFQTLSVNGSVSLIIVNVSESDAGLYYCGGRLSGQHLLFGNAILLNSTGGGGGEGGVGLCWKLLVSAVLVIVLVVGLCVTIITYKLGFQTSFCKNCVKENSSLKTVDLHYASLRHVNTPQSGTMPPDHSVTYDVVARKTAANHGA